MTIVAPMMAQLGVSDAQRSINFYRDVLGFDPTMSFVSMPKDSSGGRRKWLTSVEQTSAAPAASVQPSSSPKKIDACFTP